MTAYRKKLMEVALPPALTRATILHRRVRIVQAQSAKAFNSTSLTST
jgi:hypothetical protein